MPLRSTKSTWQSVEQRLRECGTNEWSAGWWTVEMETVEMETVGQDTDGGADKVTITAPYLMLGPGDKTGLTQFSPPYLSASCPHNGRYET